MTVSRRMFLRSAAATAGGLAFTSTACSGEARGGETWSPQSQTPPGEGLAPRRPVIVASANGLPATSRAAEILRDGGDPLDAVIAGVNRVERDPEDHSVGYGGLPNEDGVVELDSCVMHGPTHKAGAVAALRNIKTPSRVARLVMERTDHVLLVGEGALRFARAHGFPEENLLTDAARREWLKWKEARRGDDWIAPSGAESEAGEDADAPWSGISAGPGQPEFTYGTINCCAVDAHGDLGGVTTTSGLSYKLPGRVGDSPIIGAGLYVDNAVGAAGATGRGEAVILEAGSAAIVEQMRTGKSPTDACLEVLRRMVAHTRDPRLKRQDGLPNYGVTFYAVRKDGLYGSASLWDGGQFAVFSEGRNRLEDCAYLYDRPADMRRERRRAR